MSSYGVDPAGDSLQEGLGILPWSVMLLKCLSNTSHERPALDKELAKEAKAIVALAFRNGPIENIHSGKICPNCNGEIGYSRISDEWMKIIIMKNAVDHPYKLVLVG
jgi:hypothetical protein